MDWSLYDSDLCHERVKEDQDVNLLAELLFFGARKLN